jgi:2-amino-4-hydroxy-6-hydroxymethyldihydropteridine diphosphokinase
MKISENIAIALGGNIGDVNAVFQKAIALIKKNGVEKIKISSLYANPAVDCIPETPDFTNAVLTGKWQGSPHELLSLCKKIETTLGRPKNHTSHRLKPICLPKSKQSQESAHNIPYIKNSPIYTSRIVDLDIILFGRQVINEDDLQIPHKKAHERLFVLVPLAEIAAEWLFPDKRCTAKDLLNNLKHSHPL